MVTPAREGALGPLWRPRLPRPTTALRTALVAVLLATAAGVLYAGDPGSCPPTATPPQKPAATGSAKPTATESAGADDPRRALPAGAVGLPVRLAEPAALAVLRPGDRVDLLALPRGAAAGPRVVAAGALVLAVPDPDSAAGTLYLAVRPEAARRTTALPHDTRFGVIVLRG
ncbi:hypothetical protein SAMN05444365_101476 [Micromonospora pattaloongensis]|uniref:Flagellar biosynthesis protein FlgA n=1 Tax=Micromonospora pattaloongensis TaxID=405436 RepID=A0A1H3GMU9_9ACTN|nr:hypothetical protein [Micromonospora pattaloongensis]SDY04360.1 hypothetical protein SAMN05444365_101476 [Micromonospora pattaloongensis]